ncbi:MAG: FAD-dependent oxidoreductase [Schwartzia sp.]|nr:FAD-dependent oxidoreductase [Schwartzia sp. (in: firmicutes)]
MSFNCPELPNSCSATNPIEYAQAVQVGQKMQRELIEYFRRNMPGFSKAYISRSASILGVRESWRIRGKLIMTGKDY